MRRIHAGDESAPWYVGHFLTDSVGDESNTPQPLDASYSCTMTLLDEHGVIVVPERPVTLTTADGLYFACWLTAADTLQPTAEGGRFYELVIQISNDSLQKPLRREQHIWVTIVPGDLP